MDNEIAITILPILIKALVFSPLMIMAKISLLSLVVIALVLLPLLIMELKAVVLLSLLHARR